MVIRRLIRLKQKFDLRNTSEAPCSESTMDAVSTQALPTAGMEEIRESFDESFYLSQYPDVKESDLGPLGHYWAHGWKEHRDPCPDFSTKYYLENNPLGLETSPST